MLRLVDGGWAMVIAMAAVAGSLSTDGVAAVPTGNCSLVVTNTAEFGAGSLREAILCANSTAGHDTIAFGIPGDGPHVLQLNTQLPEITEGVTIDGFTQPGSRPNASSTAETDALLKVEIRGSSQVNDGLTLRAPACVIRGLAIGAFAYTAIRVLSDSNLIAGNFLGTDASGLHASPNQKTGLLVGEYADNVIGGLTPDSRNIISGNYGAGICVKSKDADLPSILPSRRTQIWGNIVGLGVDGQPLPNDLGMQLDTSFSVGVGGRTAPAANTIAGNLGAGVVVFRGGSASVVGNQIFGNGGLGIDLELSSGGGHGDGATLNDPLDGDSGPNGLQNFPILLTASNTPTSTVVQSGLSSQALKSYYIDYYTNASCDDSGYGQGRYYLGRQTVVTDPLGATQFPFEIQPALPSGTVITATATTVAGETSEFSRCVLVEAAPLSPPTLSIDDVALNEGEVAEFVVSLSAPAQTVITLEAHTADGSAKAPDDYSGIVSTNLTFAVGETSKTLQVATIDDTIDELEETFSVIIGDVAGATVVRGSATATIAGLDPEPQTPPVLSVGLKASPDPVTVGTLVTYSVFLTNLGPTSATQLRIENTLPAGLSNVVLTSGGDACQLANGKVACDYGVVTNGQILSLTIQGIPTQVGTLTDNVRATGNSAEGAVEPVEATVNTTVIDAPVITVEDVTVVEGVTAVFVVRVSRASTAPAAVQVFTADGSAKAPNDYSAITLATLVFAPGETNKTVNVVTVDDVIDEPRELFSLRLQNSTGAALGRDQATATIEDNDATRADLLFGMTDSPDPVEVSANLSYSIGITNAGPGTLQSVVITDTLPLGVVFSSVVSLGKGSCTNDNGTVRCSFGTLTNGEAVSIELVVTPTAAGVLTNVASATANDGLVDLGRQLQVTTTVVPSKLPRVDLSVSSLLGPVSVIVGAIAEYDLILTNAGPDSAALVFLTNNLPAGVEFVSAMMGGTNAECVLTNGRVICRLGSLEAGSSIPFRFSSQPQVTGTVTNIFTVGISGAIDTNLTNNSAIITTPVDEGPVEGLTTEFESEMKVNRQTGLLEQRLRITNNGRTDAARLRVFFGGLPDVAILYNAAGLDGGRRFFQLNEVLRVGQSIQLLLEFNLPRRQAVPNPTVTFRTGGGFLPQSPEGVGVAITRALMLSSNRFLVEFPTVAGRTYAVQYSDDEMMTWKPANPTLKAPSDRFQWLDNGPPKTDRLPSDASMRLYRVLLLPD